MTSKKTITIFGGGTTAEDDNVFQFAREIGQKLAEAGFNIANGGYGGTMLAVSKGAAEAGGKVIGVVCSAFKSTRANKYVTEKITAGSLQQRLDMLVSLGDGYVVLPGSTGTLLELAAVWELKNKGFIPAGKPVILAGDYFRPLTDLIVTADPGCGRYIQYAGSAGRIKDMILSYMGE